ncbi:hypothetical protein IWQ60_006470 [Tieghemiomyces parasiticus]|uniref:Uncharacterized protein n=1 Tax=Tieghemiomyces parasiticus TaxID=78921 RepID=A0A9W8A9U3_9FUNG|nr:hypothetical protein IWQ60_006470 [Tieghemiomyces parasiticus]
MAPQYLSESIYRTLEAQQRRRSDARLDVDTVDSDLDYDSTDSDRSTPSPTADSRRGDTGPSTNDSLITKALMSTSQQDYESNSDSAGADYDYDTDAEYEEIVSQIKFMFGSFLVPY